LAAAQTCLAQVNYNEIEPNETKATATVVAAMAPGDTLTGNSTGSVTTPGAATSVDYWNITTTAAPSAGIWQYTLAFTTNNTVTIRGLTQTNGVINPSTDTGLQTSSSASNRIVRWYANEQPSQIYLNVTGTSATTADYVLTLARTQITPTTLTTFSAGPVFVTTVGQSPVTDTEVWLYDSTFTPIVDAGNDNEPAPGTTTQSKLWRNLPAGTYFLAMATQNLANNLASPADDRSRSRAVTDFPNVTCTSSAPAANDNQSFTIGNRCTGESQTITDNASQHYKIVTFYTFALTGAGSADPTSVSAAATPATVGQGASTLLTATIAGAPATAVTADLSAFGLTGSEVLHDDGLNGDAVAGDGIWSYTLNVPGSQPTGADNINVTVTAPTSCVPPASATIALSVTPPNNACANAVPIDVGGFYPGTTIGAQNAGGLSTTCNTLTGINPGVWYKFTENSPTPRRLVCSLCDPATNFDAKLLLYTGSCGALTCVWGNENPSFGCPYQNPARNNGAAQHSDIPAIINWSPGAPGFKCTVPGEIYYISVQNSIAANGGNFVLHLDDTGETCEGTPPANDLCTAARPLTTFPTWDIVFREDATADAPVSCSDPSNTGARGSVWYTYTPTQAGNLFHAKIPDQGAAGSSTDTVVTVFSAAPDCSNLTPVACVDAVEGYTNMFTTPIAALNAGVMYYIEVSNQSPTAAIPGGENLGFNFVGTGPGPCCRNDFNGDGAVGTDADIEAFFACLSGNCCPTCPPDADFNCDGGVGTDADIESFFRVLSGGAC
jgi:hypothetical protein